MTDSIRTQVGIIGGGTSGLLLSQLLHLWGTDSVVLEKHNRDYVLGRSRAGVREHSVAALMREAQGGERMDREGQIHEGFFIAHGGVRHRIDLEKLTGGKTVMVYGQTELTRDLYEARDRLGGLVVHEARDVRPHDVETAQPYLTYRQGDETLRVDCDFIVGCDDHRSIDREEHRAATLVRGGAHALRESLSRRGRRAHRATDRCSRTQYRGFGYPLPVSRAGRSLHRRR